MRISAWKLVVAVILPLMLVVSQSTFAHSEHDKGRFVAPNGKDEGRCDNRFRPCKSILYAAQNANKGDVILVAKGNYQISSDAELLYMMSEVVPVKGGYNTQDNYQVQNPTQHVTRLVGIPQEFAGRLYQKGFSIIVDSKEKQAKPSNQSVDVIAQLNQQHQAADCVDGEADGFSCNNIDLVSHIPLSKFPNSPSSGNDIWGHVDLNTMNEYALMGLRNGVSVINLSDPALPRIVGTISGQSTTWRDIKVYQHFDSGLNQWRAYAYVTADNAGEGTLIIDLNQLPDSVSLLSRNMTDASAHNVYISNVDYGLNIALRNQTPQLHNVGQDNFGGAFRSYSLDNPESLEVSYSPDSLTRADYTHDASSVLIDDARAQQSCFGAPSSCTVMLDFNENEFRLWDHTNTDNALELGSASYPNVEYTHSGWWTEDKQYVIVHDELDEQRVGINTTINIFDISNLNNPTLVGTWVGETRAIDHNGFVRGNRYYMSNYERGLTILDITDPTSPEEVGFFDTYTISNNSSFNGAWGVYPYLPSGLILVSDMSSGFYVLRDNTRTNQIAFTAATLSVDEGSSATIEVSNPSGIASEVQYRIQPGSANDSDYEFLTGSLTWPSGDSSNKSFSINIIEDGDNTEFNEVFFVRLFNPTNGVSLGNDNLAVVTINGLAQTGSVSFSANSQTILETDGQVTIPVTRTGGSSGELVVNYELLSGTGTSGEDATLASGTLTWADGETEAQNIVLTITDDNDSESTETLTLQLTSESQNALGANAQITISIRDDESNAAPTADAGSDTQVNTRQTVALSGSGQDPEGDSLVYSWEQTAGTSVSLDASDIASPSFTAPDAETTLTFELTVADNFGVTGTDSVSISVLAPIPTEQPDPPSSGGGGSLNQLILGLLAAIAAVRLRRNHPKLH